MEAVDEEEGSEGVGRELELELAKREVVKRGEDVEVVVRGSDERIG